MVSLSAVSFERLRELGLSVTQSKRVLKYRDEHGFASVDDLDNVPGFPRVFLAELKGRLVP
jgi:DNA uptake protein ComE-like DNA-binding protein